MLLLLELRLLVCVLLLLLVESLRLLLREELLVLHERGVLSLLPVRVRRLLLLALIRRSVCHRRSRLLCRVSTGEVWERGERTKRPLAQVGTKRRRR